MNIFDSDDWTTQYKLLMYKFCKSRGRPNFNIKSLISSIDKNMSLDAFNTINEINQYDFSEDELSTHLSYFVQTLLKLAFDGAMFDYGSQPTKQQQKKDEEKINNNYKELFQNGKFHTDFNRQELLKTVNDHFNTLMYTCFMLSDKGYGDVPFSEIDPETVPENKPDAETIKNLLTVAEYVAKDVDKHQKIGLKVRDYPNVDMSDDDTPNSILVRIYRVLKAYNLDKFNDIQNSTSGGLNQGEYEKWFSDVLKKRLRTQDDQLVQNQLDVIRNMNFDITVTPDKKNSLYDFTISYGVPDFSAFITTMNKLAGTNRIKRFAFLPPIDILYDFCALSNHLMISKDHSNQRIKVSGQIPCIKTKELEKDPVTKKVLEYLDYMSTEKFSVDMIEFMNKNTNYWNDYINKFLYTGSEDIIRPEPEIKSSDDTPNRGDEFGANVGDEIATAQTNNETDDYEEFDDDDIDV